MQKIRLIIKVISGGQNGADIAGVRTARRYGIPTGGTMPAGFKTLDGPRPQYADLYSICEAESPYGEAVRCSAPDLFRVGDEGDPKRK